MIVGMCWRAALIEPRHETQCVQRDGTFYNSLHYYMIGDKLFKLKLEINSIFNQTVRTVLLTEIKIFVTLKKKKKKSNTYIARFI
jgi:hypothetical protein